MAYPQGDGIGKSDNLEKVTFIRGDKPVNNKRYHEEKSSGCCGNCSKKKICCLSCLGCVLLVLLVGGGLFLYVQNLPDKSGDAAKWDAMLADGSEEVISMDGNYTLVSYDDNYSPYLTALGIPWYVVPLILAGSEKLEIVITEEGAEIKTITDWMSRTQNFAFNKVFNMTYGKGMGVMWNVCSLSQPHVVSCESEERERGWRLNSKMIFGAQGMINERHFLNEDIVAKKYYQKGDDVEVEAESSDIDIMDVSEDGEGSADWDVEDW